MLVPISRFTARNFRCLESVEFEPDPAYTLIWGANASGKTSILEALAYLGRGKSFRSSQTGHLIRHGQQEFLLYGEVLLGARVARLGVRNSPAGLEVRVDGDSDGGVAALAATLPLQVIDPAVHHLVSGGPDERRRFLDWMVFHDLRAGWATKMSEAGTPPRTLMKLAGWSKMETAEGYMRNTQNSDKLALEAMDRAFGGS